VFLVRGEYRDLMRRLFRHEGGRVRLGTALSLEPVTDLDRLAEWTEFGDCILEGVVNYSLRVREVPDGLALAVRFKGMNRDNYVAPALRSYIRWEGLGAEPVEGGG
jgi:hypothetical protein